MPAAQRPINSLARAVKRGYRALLGAYPPAFQEQFAPEMADVFADQVDERARLGVGPVCLLAARESWQSGGAILRAHWSSRGQTAARMRDALLRALAVLFNPPPGGEVDGSITPGRLFLEAAVFLILGASLVLTTYLPARLAPAAFRPLLGVQQGLALLAPPLLLLAGMARGMPRWAYPPLGCVLAAALLACLVTGFFWQVLLLVALAAAVAALARFTDRRAPILPPAARAWKRRVVVDPMRLSFAVYGTMPLVIILAFDDAVINNRTPCLFAAVLGMVAGSLLFSALRRPWAGAGALLAGMTVVVFSAALDQALLARSAWSRMGWFLGLWAVLAVLLLLPGLAALLRRLKQPAVDHSTGV